MGYLPGDFAFELGSTNCFVPPGRKIGTNFGP